MSILRNNPNIDNLSPKGKSVGGKLYSLTGLKFFQPKHMEILNSDHHKLIPHSRKI